MTLALGNSSPHILIVCILGGGYDCSCGSAVGCRSGYTRSGMVGDPRVPPPCQSELACVAEGNALIHVQCFLLIK